MAEARVLYGSQGGSILYGGGSFLCGGGSWRPGIPSLAHVACARFSYYPYWISLYKLCIGYGFPAINSAAQLSTVGFSFLVLNVNGFFFLLLVVL